MAKNFFQYEKRKRDLAKKKKKEEKRLKKQQRKQESLEQNEGEDLPVSEEPGDEELASESP